MIFINLLILIQHVKANQEIFRPSDWIVKNSDRFNFYSQDKKRYDRDDNNNRYHYHHHHLFLHQDQEYLGEGEESNAQIITSPENVSLICQVAAPSEHISWWLYKCPRTHSFLEKIQLTSGSALLNLDKFYEVEISGTEGKYSSTLRIKGLNSRETSGLYACRSFVFGGGIRTSDYFIVGKRPFLQDCFPRSRSSADLLSFLPETKFQNGIRYLLKIPINETNFQNYKISLSDDLKVPESQKSK